MSEADKKLMWAAIEWHHMEKKPIKDHFTNPATLLALGLLEAA